MARSRHDLGGLIAVLGLCAVGMCLFSYRAPARPVALFDQKDLDIIDTAENIDDSPHVSSQPVRNESGCMCMHEHEIVLLAPFFLLVDKRCCST